MKTLYKIFAIAMLLVTFAACDNTQFGETIFVDPVENTDTYTYDFDQWLKKYYTDAYNVEFIYKLNDINH